MADATGFLHCYSQLINAACHNICRYRQVTEIIRPNFQNDAVVMSVVKHRWQSVFQVQSLRSRQSFEMYLPNKHNGPSSFFINPKGRLEPAHFAIRTVIFIARHIHGIKCIVPCCMTYIRCAANTNHKIYEKPNLSSYLVDSCGALAFAVNSSALVVFLLYTTIAEKCTR